MQRSSRLCALLVSEAALLTGCMTVGNLGIVTKPSANNADRLKSGVSFEELHADPAYVIEAFKAGASAYLLKRSAARKFGPVEGSGSRHFILAIIPFGDSSFSKAVHEALGQKGGDALINVTGSTNLYGFIPIYNVYTFTCTLVRNSRQIQGM